MTPRKDFISHRLFRRWPQTGVYPGTSGCCCGYDVIYSIVIALVVIGIIGCGCNVLHTIYIFAGHRVLVLIVDHIVNLKDSGDKSRLLAAFLIPHGSRWACQWNATASLIFTLRTDDFPALRVEVNRSRWTASQFCNDGRRSCCCCCCGSGLCCCCCCCRSSSGRRFKRARLRIRTIA